MNVKRYFGKTMREAFEQVKQELGDAAIILSNRSVTGGVEVIATLPVDGGEPKSEDQLQARAGQEEIRPQALSGKVPQRAPAQGRPKEIRRQLEQLKRRRTVEEEPSVAISLQARQAGRQQRPVPATVSKAPAESNGEVLALRKELSSMRDFMAQQFNGMAWQQFSQRTPVQATLWKRLKNMGLPTKLIKDSLSALNREAELHTAWRSCLQHLSGALPLYGEDVIENGGIVALVGPTGVGKTTTVGKLATRYALAHGEDSVALVTTDTYRIAAHEQLKIFGRILGVSVRVVDEKHSLEDTLGNLRKKSLVLIDTAGLHRDDPALDRQLSSLRDSSHDIKTFLLMACTSQEQVLRNAYTAYDKAHLDGTILTKLDESGSLGQALGLAVEKGLRIAYQTNGQKIPDDISVASAASLLEQAVAMGRGRELDDEELLSNEFNLNTELVCTG